MLEFKPEKKGHMSVSISHKQVCAWPLPVSVTVFFCRQALHAAAAAALLSTRSLPPATHQPFVRTQSIATYIHSEPAYIPTHTRPPPSPLARGSLTTSGLSPPSPPGSPRKPSRAPTQRLPAQRGV